MNDNNETIISEFGFRSIYPLPSEQELAAYYQSDYYQNPHGTYQETYTPQEVQARENKFRLKLELINLHRDETLEMGYFLDVGCGEGYFLDFLYRSGYSVLGLDFSDFGIDKFNPHLLSRFIKGDIYKNLRNLQGDSKRFDVINLGNVLEHVLDPVELLSDLRSLLKPSGLLLVTVPNDFSKLHQALLLAEHIDGPFWVTPPDHLHYFTLDSLENLCSGIGLEPLDSIADFPIDWLLANPNSNYVKDPSLGPAAHASRVFIEDLINELGGSVVLNFWREMSRLGMGRTVTSLSRA